MPSPFPGMDPYLEHPEFFPGLHDRLIAYFCEALRATLRRPYYADIRTRVWIESSSRAVLPDGNVIRGTRPTPPTSGTTITGVVEVARPPIAVPVAGEEVTESYVEIHTVQGGHPLVTAIEILSPSNKAAGTQGRLQYCQKQLELLNSRVNLIEIDLLRGGQHTTAVEYNLATQRAGVFDYHVCVRKMDELTRFFVYPIRLLDRLPELAVPLLPGDGEVKIDLQSLFDRSYDAGPYEIVNPYGEIVPEPPLRSDQGSWAEAILRDKGLLPND